MHVDIHQAEADIARLKEEMEGLTPVQKMIKSGENKQLQIRLQKLCEEKTAEYAQMLLELQAEKRQRFAEYAARQLEFDRLQEEHGKDIKCTQQAREEYER